jgi:hypothetical protein
LIQIHIALAQSLYSKRQHYILAKALTSPHAEGYSTATRVATGVFDLQVHRIGSAKEHSVAALGDTMKDFFDRTYYPVLDRSNYENVH